MFRILVINPGSTSTKISVYEDEKNAFTRSIRHEAETEKYPGLDEQLGFREKMILDTLKEEKYELKDMDAIVGRGGLLHPVIGGTYLVNEDMLSDLQKSRYGWHASNLGAILADRFARPLGIPCYIADPVVVDEKIPEARYSGFPGIERLSIDHPLNQKAMAKRYAREHGKKYADMNFVIAHMGGGLSVNAHQRGRIVDGDNALDGDGPFSAERSGGLPLRGVLDMAFSGKYTRESIQATLVGHGGLYAYLGTKDGLEIARRIDSGDKKAAEVIRAMALQVAKSIGACAAVLKGKVDAIIITGGLAYLEPLTAGIEELVEWIAPVVLFPGEDEMGALALAAREVLSGETEALVYHCEPADK